MALGVPVVAGRDSGAVPWVLGGDSGGGALVDVRSPEKIAEAVLKLLETPECYVRCSERGRARASEVFSPAAVAQSYLEHYQQVLADCDRVRARATGEVSA
jgi:glycosyltransferase involved in cell wall biosynthesis